MQTWLFKSLGAAAGLAGIALGIVLVLYRDIIASDLLSSTLCQTQSYNVLLSIIVFVFGIAAVGIVAWVISLSKPADSHIATKRIAIVAGSIIPIIIASIFILIKEPSCPPLPIGDNVINIRKAEYAARRNVHGMSSVARACQANKSCNFPCGNAYADHGDPKEGDHKKCIVLYNCSFTPNYEQKSVTGEDRPGSISCPQKQSMN